MAGCQAGAPPISGAPEACTTCIDTIGISSADLSLSQIEALDVDSHGNIYLADAGVHSVIMLAPDGRLITRFGRGGAGPGEFQSLFGLQVLAGDTVVVTDPSLARLTFFAPLDHRVVRTITMSPAHGGIPVSAIVAGAPRRFVVTFEQPFTAGGPQASDSARVVVVGTMDSTGRIVADSILAVPGSQTLVARSGGMVTARMNPFASQPVFQVARGRLYYVLTAVPSIESQTLSGEARSTVRLPYAPVPLTARAIEDTASKLPDYLREPLRHSAPQTWPVLREFVMDSAGNAWVGVVTDPGKTVSWIAVDRTGRLSERVDMPWNVGLRAARGDMLYAVVLGEDDVPRVLILQNRSPSPTARAH